MTALEWGDATSRRRVLKLAGMAGAVVGVGRLGTTQVTEITLDGSVSGWVGRTPESISGETNPALTLTPGQTY